MGKERARSGEINTKLVFCEGKKKDFVSYLKPEEKYIENEGVVFATKQGQV